MVLFNHSTRELTAKIVYYGPGLCGKTTNLRVLHERLEKGTAGRLLSLATAQDRTIYFDLLPVELGNIKGYTVRFQLCTVPGQVFYNETRKLVLRGVDGVVFVVDSQWSMLSHDLESFQNLVENLRDLSVGIESLPVIIQYNKRDLPGVLSVDALQESLGFPSYPYVEAVASTGQGVIETFKLVSKLTFVDLLRRLQRSGGLESDALSSGRASAPDPGEETMVRARSGPPAKKSSFATTAEAAEAIAAGANAVAAMPGGTVAAAESQPFDAEPGWIPTTDSDVFGAPAAETAAAAAVAAEPDPFTPPAPAPEPEAIATESDVVEAPPSFAPPIVAVAPSPPAAPAPPDPAVTEAIERHAELLTALRADLEGQRAETTRLLEETRAALAPKDEHDALAAELKEQKAAADALRAELAAQRTDLTTLRGDLDTLRAELGTARSELGGELQAARASLGESVETLASSLNERLSGVGADLFAARAEAEKAQAEASERHRALADKADAAEQELAEAHRRINERIEATERRTKTLAEAIRKALESLGD